MCGGAAAAVLGITAAHKIAKTQILDIAAR
jgi:hypothetical protein